MKPTDRQKMCPNCDGRVPYDATQCPYCSTALAPGGGSSADQFKNQAVQDSLYSPPYAAPRAPIFQAEEKRNVEAAPAPAEVRTQESAPSDSIFWPVLLFTLGGNLLTLGILQFFFSENGTVSLEVGAGYWFLLVLMALPLLYFGFKMTKSD
jgi:hypothetical protein